MTDRPIVVCLCGSTRFKQAFIDANFRETMAGRIVLSVGWFSHADATVYALSDAEKAALDDLHLRKIDLADEVLVINCRGYIGSSTMKEIAYAKSLGKPVRYLEPCDADAPILQPDSGATGHQEVS
jgi:hypothetical protein